MFDDGKNELSEVAFLNNSGKWQAEDPNSAYTINLVTAADQAVSKRNVIPDDKRVKGSDLKWDQNLKAGKHVNPAVSFGVAQNDLVVAIQNEHDANAAIGTNLTQASHNNPLINNLCGKVLNESIGGSSETTANVVSAGHMQ